MRKFLKIKVSVLFLVLVFTSSCKNYYRINTDPNNITDAQVSTTAVLTNVQVSTAFLVGNHLNLITQLWMQYASGTGTQTAPYDAYQFLPGDGETNTTWSVAYAQTLADIEILIRKANQQQDFIHAGMAQVLRVYVYALLVDAYDSVPFSQATAAAAGRTGNLAPAYDAGQAIYTQLFTDLDAAIANLNLTNAATPVATGDIIYSGSAANWIRAAQTLRLRLGLNVLRVNPAQGAAQINAAIASGNLITTNAQNFTVSFNNIAGSFLPLFQYNYASRRLDLCISPTLVNTMNANADPRIGMYLTTTPALTPANIYPNGLHVATPTTLGDTRVRYGIYVVNANQGTVSLGAVPLRMLTAAQVQFMLAEAELVNPGSVNAPLSVVGHFQQGIQNSMDDVRTFTVAAPNVNSVTATNATTYITNRVTAYGLLTTDNARLGFILTEKWLAGIGNAFEAWVDIRRTGGVAPALTTASNSQLGASGVAATPGANFPSSFPYPQQEINFNAANVPAGANSLVRRIFWMP